MSLFDRVMPYKPLVENGFAFDSDPAYTLRLLHREDYITSFRWPP